MDLHGCDPKTFTRKSLKKFLKKLCKRIKMKRAKLVWWDYKGDKKGYKNAPAHLKGISAVQFIQTSNITIHTLDDLGSIYLNIFSCKDFDIEIVENFTKNWFKGNIVHWESIERL